MRKKAILVLLAVLLSISCWAQGSNISNTVSPKLRQFLADHPAASRALSNALSEAFASRTVRLYYFYSDDESVARASHSYPDDSAVRIVIRENQEPCDECIGLIFEVLNSEGEKRFAELEQEAKFETLSKADFVKGIMMQEFQAVKKTRELIGNFKLSEKEITASYFYNRLIQCPNEFDEYLAYKKKVSPKRDDVTFYERQYDLLQKTP